MFHCFDANFRSKCHCSLRYIHCCIFSLVPVRHNNTDLVLRGLPFHQQHPLSNLPRTQLSFSVFWFVKFVECFKILVFYFNKYGSELYIPVSIWSIKSNELVLGKSIEQRLFILVKGCMFVALNHKEMQRLHIVVFYPFQHIHYIIIGDS